MITEIVVKEIAESTRQELAEHGYVIFNRVYDENFIEKAKALFDLPESDGGSELVHFGSEKRIWGAEHMSPAAADFMSQSDALFKRYFGKNTVYTPLWVKKLSK
jgi:hypothetical protein